MNSLSSLGVSIVLTIVILVLIVSRQLRERPVKEERGLRGIFIISIIGLVQLFDYIQKNPKTLQTSAVIFLLLGLISALVFGWLRARFMHVWRDKGQLMRQGNISTILLWVVSIALHFGLDTAAQHMSNDKIASGLASASIVLYLAISLGAQKYVVLERAKAITEDPQRPIVQ